MATTTEMALTLISPPDLRLPEIEEKGLSALVERKIEETKTLTLVSTNEQFEAAGEELRAIAQLRSQLESAVRPYITFWHQGHKTHTQLLATLDGPPEARERSIKQGLSRYQREKEEALAEPEARVPTVLVAPVVQASTPKVRGVGFRDVPKWRMQCGHERADDPNCATCRCVPREYLVLDPKRV